MYSWWIMVTEETFTIDKISLSSVRSNKSIPQAQSQYKMLDRWQVSCPVKASVDLEQWLTWSYKYSSDSLYSNHRICGKMGSTCVKKITYKTKQILQAKSCLAWFQPETQICFRVVSEGASDIKLPNQTRRATCCAAKSSEK